ncbi:tryptophan-rich sensory protein [Candidatus Dependentiae bacterium]|nr:tryptophan-rich sensory protein [Candidatus Dependentiae bacterium]
MEISYIIIPAFYIGVMIAGTWFSQKGMAWYRTLSVPNFTPPAWFFSLAWAILYILMIVSAILWWHSQQSWCQTTTIAALYVINAFINVQWSYLFFCRHLIGWSIINTIALEISIWALMYMLWPINPAAALVLVPYGTWVLFAMFINVLVWWRN